MSNVVGGRPLGLTSDVLMIAARMISGPAYPEMIEEIDRELTKVTDDFNRAVHIEAIRVTNETGKFSSSHIVDS